MMIDTPATIAVLGAGPIGLEAALYARFLGYEVHVYEQGRVAEGVRGWEQQPMQAPFGRNRSPLGLAALAAQDPDWVPPGDEEILTGQEYLARYLEPLAQSDLVADSLHSHTTVLSVARRANVEPTEREDDAPREHTFDIRLTDAEGNEQLATADIVLDCTGLSAGDDAQPDWSIVRELNLELDPASEAPQSMAARLADFAGGSPEPPLFAAEDFLTPEPEFYVLGAKSYGRDERFHLAHGYAQIVALFSGIAGRKTLDLYATALPAGDNSSAE